MKNAIEILLVVCLLPMVTVKAYFKPKPNEWYMILSRSNGKALDAERSNSSQTFPFDYKNTQIFRFKVAKLTGISRRYYFGILYRIFDAEYDQVLEVVGEYPHDDVGRAPLKTNRQRQLWSIEERPPFEEGYFLIKNFGNHQCLDVYNNNTVNTSDCNDSNRGWTIAPLC